MDIQPTEVRITIAIPCYNAEHTIGILLERITSVLPTETQIIVVNDGSTDGTVSQALQYRCEVITHQTRAGVAKARNTAYQAATGDIIIFFDADTVPDKKCIQAMINEYTSTEVGGVGGQESDSLQRNIYDAWRRFFWRQTHGEQRIDSVWMLPGLCCSYRKEVLSAVHGFDESYRTHGEDIDISLRIRKAGFILVYTPEARVFHNRSDSLYSLSRMIFNHSYWQMRAIIGREAIVRKLFLNSLKWFVVTVGSSIKRRHNLALAVLSPFFCSIAFYGLCLGLGSSLIGNKRGNN